MIETPFRMRMSFLPVNLMRYGMKSPKIFHRLQWVLFVRRMKTAKTVQAMRRIKMRA